jgi:KaiC/GvpD/RAD55 family RecA-like ATPase
MRRLTTTLLIIVIGGLVLWEVLAQGTRTWTKYGLLKQPLPSIATLLDPTLPFMSMIMTISIVLTTAMITTMAVIRSRKLLGIIPVKELRRHALIVGPTGSGKTTIAKRIVEMAAKRDVRVTILDWKGEYTSYVKNAVVVRKVNIWDNGGRTPTEKAVIAVEMLREITRDIADVSSASAALLLKELIKLYREKETPTTKDVVDRLDRFMQTALAERRLAEANMAAALLRRLHWLLLDEESPDENENAYRNPAVTIYDLSSTSSSYLKTLYALAILSKKYYMALKTGTNNELLEILVAEEAQNFAYTRRVGEPPSMAERIIYELRGYGVGVILVCPDPELLPMAVLKDVGAVISTSPDTLPRFALERHLFRASLEEAEDVLKRLKKARMIVYFRGRLYFLRRLPKLPKVLKPKGPKGDRMGVTDSGVGSLRAWPILPHRSPGRPTVVEVKEEVTEGPKVVEVEEVKVEEKPRVLEVKVVEEKTEAESEAAEVEERPKDVEPLRLEEELEEPEAEVEVEKSPETIAEKEEKLEEPEPAPKGPPIPSTLPYRGSLCPAGRPHLTPVR